MAQTCTTSIRMDEQLAHRLDDAAIKLHRRKNGIIIHAIEEYLDKNAKILLQDEAREQSLLAGKRDHEADSWEESYDDSGWQ